MAAQSSKNNFQILSKRWYAEDYPGGKPQFQISLLLKDFSVFALLPTLAIVFFKSCETAFSSEQRKKQKSEDSKQQQEKPVSNSQIIEFERKRNSNNPYGIQTKAPGTLVKVRLLNTVEVYSGAPVHAQVIDAGLGQNILGGTLIGDASSDTNFEKINVAFRYLKIPRNQSVAIPVAARALSLDGTLGVAAIKKEGFFARSAISAAGLASAEEKDNSENGNLKQLIAKALTSGLLQEFNNENQIAKNRSQVLTLKPATEFFVELTDYFPTKN